MVIRSHRDLEVWQKGMEIVEELYRLTSGFPEEEKYGLTSQMRRAAVSVPSNIAEGSAKQTGNFRRHIEDELWLPYLDIAYKCEADIMNNVRLIGGIQYESD